MLRFTRHRRFITLLVAIVAFGVFAVAAFADAPDATQTTNYSNLGFAPNQMSVAGVSYDPNGAGGLGTTTLTVKGGWAWPTHGSDCNTDRAGAGYAMDWFDPNDAGYAIGATGIAVGSQNPNGFAANTDGNVVQPTPSANDPSNPAAVRKVAAPSDFANWGSGCGKVAAGTVTGWQGGGNPPTSFSQGYLGPIAHTYIGAPGDLPNKVCVITYDVHKGSTPASHADGLGIPGNAGEITAGGANRNDDNSVESNDKTPAGNVCAAILLPELQIVKTADAAQVNAGDTIGFTVTVFNNGQGDATGVTLSDPLPTNAGLNWSIDAQGAGWGGSCAIANGTLSCGPATVPAGTTQAASSFTVHITSGTTADTGGSCPGGTGVVDNTGYVDSTNAGSGQSSADTCVQGSTDLQITKSGAPKNQHLPVSTPYQDITWTIVVTNNGPLDDTNVMVSDALPAHTTYVSSSTTQGTCTGGAILICSLGTLQVDDSVTITLVTTPDAGFEGQIPNTASVSGDLPESDQANNEASDTVLVTRLHVLPCVALIVKPKSWLVGQLTKVTIKVRSAGKAKAGVRVRLTGAGINLTSKASNKRGVIVMRIKATRKGAVRFSPMNHSACALVRVGVTPPNPPVTG